MTNRLDANTADLRPRNHLYVSAGVTNLAINFTFNTTTLPNGYHDLTAMVYEGSHVRTQQRVTQTVYIQNNPLTASFGVTPTGDTEVLEALLQFSVTANTNNIAKIELFSTGGLIASSMGQTSATFTITGTNLGLGLHPFYALVTAMTGKQYRTETRWIRLIASSAAFPVTISGPPTHLFWPASPGRGYNILSTTNLSNTFQLAGSVTATNYSAAWTDTNLAVRQRFYRVRTAN
jgi:hypothetical protein